MASKTLAVLDIETDPFKIGRVPEPFLVGIRWEDKQAKFSDVGEACEFLRKKKFRCYAHNGGKFDYMYFLKYMSAGTNLKLINGRLAEFKLGESTMRDSFCRYPMALKTHRKLEIDYDKMEKHNRAAYWAEINEYLDEDLDSLYELMKYGESTYGTGLTLAGCAMKFWEKQNDIKAPRSNAAYYAQFEPFYFGGRVEAPKLGLYQGDISVYDINSAYPFAMLHPHPWGLNHDVYGSVKASFIRGQDFVTVEAPSLGFWPVKGKDYGKEEDPEVFPSDGQSRIFNITGWEFQAVMDFFPELPHKIIRVFRFKASIEFQKYVEHFYLLKKNAIKNSPEYLFAKLMMNSLYGKFGANPAEYRDYMIVPALEWLDWEDCTRYKLADIIHPWARMSSELSEEAQHYYDVATAASITGFPRAYGLRALVRSFGRNFREHPSYYYYDTDGIHAATGSLDVELGKDLGQWNVEFRADRAAYYGPKGYCLTDSNYDFVRNGVGPGNQEIGAKMACKGVRINSDEIIRAASGHIIKWENSAPTMSVKGGVKFLARNVGLKSEVRKLRRDQKK